MLSELLPKNTGQTRIVNNDHIGVMPVDVIVLPTFVPPAKANDGRPAIREKIIKLRVCPKRDIDISVVQIAAKLGDNYRLSGRDSRQARVRFVNLGAKAF